MVFKVLPPPNTIGHTYFTWQTPIPCLTFILVGLVHIQATVKDTLTHTTYRTCKHTHQPNGIGSFADARNQPE